MRSPFLIAYFAMIIVAVRGILDWMGADVVQGLSNDLFGPYIEFWDYYQDQLTPDFEGNPVWLALGGLGALLLLRLTPRLARGLAIGVLAFLVADVSSSLAGINDRISATLGFIFWSMISFGWLMLYHTLRQPLFWLILGTQIGIF